MTPSLALIDGTKVTRSGFRSLPQTVSGAEQEKKKKERKALTFQLLVMTAAADASMHLFKKKERRRGRRGKLADNAGVLLFSES